jgi:hypothetical protein
MFEILKNIAEAQYEKKHGKPKELDPVAALVLGVVMPIVFLIAELIKLLRH